MNADDVSYSFGNNNPSMAFNQLEFHWRRWTGYTVYNLPVKHCVFSTPEYFTWFLGWLTMFFKKYAQKLATIPVKWRVSHHLSTLVKLSINYLSFLPTLSLLQLLLGIQAIVTMGVIIQRITILHNEQEKKKQQQAKRIFTSPPSVSVTDE